MFEPSGGLSAIVSQRRAFLFASCVAGFLRVFVFGGRWLGRLLCRS